MLLATAINPAAAEIATVYNLTYEEQEPGLDAYTTQYLVSGRYLRINDLSDSSGYVLYDDTKKTIYSVSHYNKSTLVMKYSDYVEIDLDALVETGYRKMQDAPAISGKPVYQYRVIDKGGSREICTDIHLAQGLLPEVTKILHNYWLVIASNQVKNIHKTPKEFQTTCYISDQVYNTGEYYTKGLPILEWHSNSKKKVLIDYAMIEPSDDMFSLPLEYNMFSVDNIDE